MPLTGSKVSESLFRLALVIGGARSGKSCLAERLAVATACPRVLIATAEAGDDEMAARIARHRADRGAGWTVIEEPVDVAGALARVPGGVVTVIDCATLWLTNLMISGRDPGAGADGLIRALGGTAGPVIVVSNEVGLGIVPDNALARAFRDEQGRLNRRLAGAADLVVGVMAGLPFALKGALPDLPATDDKPE
jgi:adenosylcobinamide kinase/adenosylcobinamide-phosphate guanylyltransferase